MSCSASFAVVRDIVASHLKRKNCTTDDSVITSLAEEICKSNPISTALREEGPLASAFKRRQYFKHTFKVVEPVEYVLDLNENRTFQYVPILQSLLQILGNKDVLEKAFTRIRPLGTSTKYESFYDGNIFRQNPFFSEELRLSIVLFVDDFEVCNPLGTSRKKHKITAVYWVLQMYPLDIGLISHQSTWRFFAKLMILNDLAIEKFLSLY